MKVVKFHRQLKDMVYHCYENGDKSGTYILSSEAEAELASLRANCDAQQKAIEHLMRQLEAAISQLKNLINSEV